jgi:nitrite reductase/ring-hydroxylating ferredoxin subunit
MDDVSAPVAPAWIRVKRLAEVPVGDVVAIELRHGALVRQLVLGRDGDRVFAAQRRCPHQGGDLADGIVARGHLVCPVHTWRFSTTTGALDVSPATCLQMFAVRVVEGDVEVWSAPSPAAALASPGPG